MRVARPASFPSAALQCRVPARSVVCTPNKGVTNSGVCGQQGPPALCLQYPVTARSVGCKNRGEGLCIAQQRPASLQSAVLQCPVTARTVPHMETEQAHRVLTFFRFSYQECPLFLYAPATIWLLETSWLQVAAVRDTFNARTALRHAKGLLRPLSCSYPRTGQAHARPVANSTGWGCLILCCKHGLYLLRR